MTDEHREIGAAGPPWSVDLLADLHAGVLDEHAAAELWPRVQSDPEARAVVEALQSVTADLATLATAPAPPMPADVAARIDNALAAEARGVAPVVDLAAARRRRNRRIGWVSGVVAVAAAAVAAIAITVPGTSNQTGTPVAAPPPVSSQPDGSALALRSDEPQAAVGELSSGAKDYGPLGDAQHLSTCLQQAGFAATAAPIGVRPGTLDGQPAVFALLTTGKLAEFRLVALSPDCGPKPLLDRVVGK